MKPIRVITLALICIATIMSSFGSTVRRPDFAFPEKVSETARQELKAALASGNDVRALRAALNLTLAQNIIDSDRMPKALECLDSLAESFATPAPRAVCDIIRATIYTAYFRESQWTIEQRPVTTPDTPLPEDYTEWNAAQFESRVSELLNSAMAMPEALLATPLRNYDPLLAVSSKDAGVIYTFYPSLLDFVGGQAIDLISSFRTPQARHLADEYRNVMIRLDADSPAPLLVQKINEIMGASLSSQQLRDRLYDLYESYTGTQYSGEILISLGHVVSPDDIDESRRLKSYIDRFLSRYPSYIRAANLRNILTRLTAPRASVSFRSSVVPGDHLPFQATSFNTGSLTVSLYRLPASYIDNGDDYYRLKNGVIPSSLTRIASRKLIFEGEAPFRAETSDSIIVPDPGIYILVADAPGMTGNSNPRIIRASALSAGVLTFGKDVTLMVVDPLSGSPVSDVTLIGSKGTKKELGKTSGDGFFDLKDNDNNGLRVRPVKGQDRFAPAVRVWNHGEGPDSLRRFYVQVYTDLALYHPGDTMRFAAVVYSIMGQAIETAPGVTAEAVIYDANHTPVDTVQAVTDRFGRIEGNILLPDDGRLNGDYSIAVTYGNTTGRTYFTVSDYKLPTFEVSADPAATGTPEEGAVTLSGRVMTYSGMPVQDATVVINVEREYLWRYGGYSEPYEFTPLRLETTTGQDGRWETVITPAQLKGAGPGAWMRASITATSCAGESQATQTVFSLGPSLRIRTRLPQAINTSRAITLPVDVINPSGESVAGIKIGYTITPQSGNDADSVSSGTFLSGSSSVDWSAITPGTYTLTFTIEGDSRECYGIALYNPDIDRSPSTALLWTPENEIPYAHGGDNYILLGTAMTATHVLYTLYDCENIIERKWLTLPAGLHRIPVNLQHGGSPDLRVLFSATGNYETATMTLTLKPAIDPRGLTIKAEAMRDRVVPGAEEKWTFSIVNATGTPVEAAVMADMYNKALDALSPSRWYLNVRSPRSLHLNLTPPEAGDMEGLYLYGRTDRMLPEIVYRLPDLQLYGQTLAPQSWRRRNMVMMMPRMMKAEAKGIDDAEAAYAVEEVELDVVADNGMAYTTASTDMKSSIQIRGAGKEMTKEESAQMEGGAEQDAQERFGYRDAEIPLALFRPMLSTGRDGQLELTFTLPDANATWAFQAIAFTDDMRSARFDASVIASKPIMVKPNLPRFLREGDTAEVLTSVMNATDSLQQVEIISEIFDPLSGEIIARQSETIGIEGGATSIISSHIEAAPGMAMLGFRVKASTPVFADGEQNVLSILPASQPVMDSAPFYLGPDTDRASITLPAAPEASESVSTLEFCENPVWYVVTALPGLAASDPITAPAAADALFSSIMARGLIERYPVIASALAEWTSRGSDNEELTSMLERNQDLKTMLLNATPWVADAMSDTERMRRLALLFDSKRVDKSINDAIGVLTRLQHKSGGLTWIASDGHPSLWATYAVLSRIAILNSYGFLNEKTSTDRQLLDLTGKAIDYIDANAAELHKEHPETPQIGFAALRTLFPDIKMSTVTESILAVATQTVVKDWKSFSLDSKPEAAMLLWRRNYKSVARDILASMRQFMVTDPDKGTYFPSLQNQAAGYLTYTADALRAFALIEPGCPEIDGLRHWLVVQKQATDWGSSSGATEVVAAILSSSRDWLGDASGTSVDVNGSKLKIPATDRRLGYFRVPLDIRPDSDISILIAKKGNTPAWGAIMRRAVAPLRAIEASSHLDISIEKSIIGSDTLTIGHKVTVRLVVRVARNLNYVAITDDRAACFEPVDPLPGVQFQEGVPFYIEPRDSRTSIFITTMPKGTYVISYDLYVNNAGSFASGIATVASQYAPEITAHSAGSVITVNTAAR